MSNRTRYGILLLTLVAFAHVAFGLGFKELWWDESLSLQRAEEGLGKLLVGVLTLKDGFTELDTIDQHPFFSFLLMGGLVRVAGTSEYVLRFLSAASATLMVPALWVTGRLLVRKQLAPQATPWIGALLVALSPFFLWYGQEARPYALWALLTVLSTYLLKTALDSETSSRWRKVAYGVALVSMLLTQYYAVFILPVHALILVVHFWKRDRRMAICGALAFFVAAVAILGYAYWNVTKQGGGANFPRISLRMLLPDLLNAFTLGLSVDIAKVYWLDAIFALLMLAGGWWLVRSRTAMQKGGWIVPLMVLAPVGVLLVGSAIQNLYMNARHMSLIAGPLLLLVATGVALVLSRWRWLGRALLVLLLAGFTYSTVNYYTREEYAKDDYSRFGEYLDGRFMPGDAILYYPGSSWRIFEYYAPMQPVHDAIAQGAPMWINSIPLLHDDDEFTGTFAFLEELGTQARRVWVLKSGTHPYFDLKGEVEAWLEEHYLQVRNAQFLSFSSLRAQLYLPQIPVIEGDPGVLPNQTNVVFGDNLRIAGYTFEVDNYADLPSAATLYWQVYQKPERRARYILELLRAQTVDGAVTYEMLGVMEREPYEGDIPVTFWDPDRTILEYIELPHTPVDATEDDLYFGLQIYDAETLEKLPVTDAAGLQTDMDGLRVLLPLSALAEGYTP